MDVMGVVMGDFFWFVIMCYFIFYLPFKLWITKDELKDIEKIAEARLYNLQTTQSVSDTWLKEAQTGKMYEDLYDIASEVLTDIYNLHERIGRVCSICKKKYPCDTINIVKGAIE